VLRDLWPFCCRCVLLLSAAACTLVPLCWYATTKAPLTTAVSAMAVTALLSAGWRGRRRWAWRFLASTRRFATLAGDRVVLRYAPELHDFCDPRDALREAETALAELEGRFGRLTLFWHGRTVGPLLFRRRVHAYLFPTYRSVGEVFGPRCGGTALLNLHAVVVQFEHPRLGEIMRHELAHLFSLRWNPFAPPFLAEGLSTWLQGGLHGYTVDGLAAGLLREPGRLLRPLLGSERFFDEADRGKNYVLAGSFAGFLVARFGWESYRKFYRGQVAEKRFDGRFKKCFGLTFEEAEGLWREDLRRRYEAPGKEWMAGLER
jgi:hypothetical protein